MPYCSECGNRNDEEDLICSSCGSDLSLKKDTGIIEGNLYQSAVKELSGNSGTKIKNQRQVMDDGIDNSQEEVAEFVTRSFSQTSSPEILPEKSGPGMDYGGYRYVEGDLHLGKGLIKPTTVQVDIDGYHFSYEKPAPQLIKAQPLNKPELVEKRLVDPEFTATPVELKPPVLCEKEENSSAVERKWPKEAPEMTDEPKPDILNLRSDDIEAEVELNETNITPGSQIKAEIEESLQESESVGTALEETVSAENNFSEIQAKIAPKEEEVEMTYLVGRQTWFGVPMPATYRITNRRIVITDQNNQTRQVELDSVLHVDLKQSFIAKLLGIGNVILKLKPVEGNPIVLMGITKPRDVVKKLESLITTKI